MKKLSLLLVLTLLFSLFGQALMSAEQHDETLVTIEQGQLTGVPGELPGVTLYKGVPFAKPPIGNLRWAAPEDPEPWEGVFKADTYAPMAMQILATDDWWGPEFYYDWFDKRPPMSEDCLYLNISVPTDKTKGPYPVLIWFHGGASMHGYSYEPEFNPEELTRKGVIVVTVAYRLGVFGYLATQALSDASPTKTSGNYGLLDQIKSMEWVQKNISAFGGDPTRVTIAGQSAGAGNVTAILTSPLAGDLFARAILNSSFGALGTRTKLADAQAKGEAWLKEKGYDNLSVEELRAKPTSDYMNENTTKPEVYGKGFGVNLDGYAVTENQIDFFKKEDALKGKSLLFGSNSGEGNGSFTIMTKADFMSSSKETYKELFDKYAFDKLYDTTDDIAATMESLRLRSERGGIQHLLIGLMLSQLNPDSGLYPYYFSHWTPGRESEIRWSWHSGELWYAFKSLRDIPQQRDWQPLDYKVAEDYSSYWANFIATGDPNGTNLPYWPSVSKENPVFMELGDTFQLRKDFYGGTKKADRDLLMREYLINTYDLGEFLE